jgi:hypothetical protein
MTRQEEITQLCKEVCYLWRPEDRLLFYVERRLHRLAVLEARPPWETYADGWNLLRRAGDGSDAAVDAGTV